MYQREIESDRKVLNRDFVVKNVHLDRNHQNWIYLINEGNLHSSIQFHGSEYLLIVFIHSIRKGNLLSRQNLTFQFSALLTSDFVWGNPKWKQDSAVLLSQQMFDFLNWNILSDLTKEREIETFLFWKLSKGWNAPFLLLVRRTFIDTEGHWFRRFDARWRLSRLFEIWWQFTG